MKGYLANGLFSEADFLYNELLAKQLREAIPNLDLYVPQENEAINDKTLYADSLMIARADTEQLEKSDFLVAVLDHMDDGMILEIGMFSMLKRPVFALFTDIRQQGRENKQKIQALLDDALENQFPYINLMVTGRIKETGGVFSNRNDLVAAIKKYVEEHQK